MMWQWLNLPLAFRLPVWAEIPNVLFQSDQTVLTVISATFAGTERERERDKRRVEKGEVETGCSSPTPGSTGQISRTIVVTLGHTHTHTHTYLSASVLTQWTNF